MADAIEAARAAYKRGNPFLMESYHEDALKAALAAADAARLKDAVYIIPVAHRYLFTDPLSGRPVWNIGHPGEWNGQKPAAVEPLYGPDAAALITAQAARIEALEKALATERVAQVRGSNDAPGFEACVNAEIESIRSTLEAEKYLIWSNEHGAWWRSNRCGYTTILAIAGRYTREEAISICARARDGFAVIGAPSEIMVREADVGESAARATLEGK